MAISRWKGVLVRWVNVFTVANQTLTWTHAPYAVNPTVDTTIVEKEKKVIIMEMNHQTKAECIEIEDV